MCIRNSPQPLIINAAQANKRFPNNHELPLDR